MPATVAPQPNPSVLTTEHHFYFATNAPITAQTLAESLLGLDGIVRRSANVLQRLLPNTTISDVDVLITSIQLGSYKENFIVRILFGEGEEAEKKIEELRKTLMLENMTGKKIVAFAITAAIAYAAWLHLKPGDPAQIHIENSFNTIGGEVGMNREQVIGVLDAALGNKKEELKKNVVKLVHPGGMASSGSLTIDQNEAFSIPTEVVENVPVQYEKDQEDEPFKDLENVQLSVRALDLDNPRRGWWAIAPDIAQERRINMRVAEDIDLRTISTGKYFYANITVFFKVDKNGNKTAKRFLLRKIVQKPGLAEALP